MNKTTSYINAKYGYEILVTPDENAFFVKVAEIPGCATEVDRFDQANEQIEDALDLWLEVAREYGVPIPEPKAK